MLLAFSFSALNFPKFLFTYRVLKLITKPVCTGDVFISILLDMEAINQLQLAVDAYTVQKSIAETRSAKIKMEKIFVDSPQHLVVHPSVDIDVQLSTELLRLEALLPKVN